MVYNILAAPVPEPMQILTEALIESTKIRIIKGDLTEVDVDTIVNAANSHLQHGGGVAGAVALKGGSIIQEESNRVGRIIIDEISTLVLRKTSIRRIDIYLMDPEITHYLFLEVERLREAS